MSISTESLSSRPGSTARDRSLVGALQADWRSMFYHEASKDVSVIVEDGQTIRIHGLVVLARCANGRLHYDNRHQINCKHLSSFAVKKILLYLYSAELEVIEATDIVPLLIAAHEFGLDNLRPYFLHCTDYLLTQINVCNVFNSAHSSAEENATSNELVNDLWRIIDSCINFISRNVQRVMCTDVVKELNCNTLKVAVSSKLPMSNQEMLKSILRWGRLKAGTKKILQSDWTEEERKIVRGYIEEIIPHVQLADGRPLSPDSVSDGVYGILERYSWAEQQRSSNCSSNVETDCLPTTLATESLILQLCQLQSCISVINEWCGPTIGGSSLLYRGSTHGFSAKQFHSRCDKIGPTLIIVQSTSGHVFGGFSDVNWHSRNRRGKFSSSQHSFLFSLWNDAPTRYCIRQPSYAINSHPNFGPIFGSGADLSISNDCNVNEDSYSRFPSSYGDDHAHSNSITNTPYFQVQDYEVFSLN